MAEEKLTQTAQPGWMDQFREFIKDVRVEFGRVSWPTRDELRDSTMVVIVMVLLISMYLFVWDQIFALVMRMLFAGGA